MHIHVITLNRVGRLIIFRINFVHVLMRLWWWIGYEMTLWSTPSRSKNIISLLKSHNFQIIYFCVTVQNETFGIHRSNSVSSVEKVNLYKIVQHTPRYFVFFMRGLVARTTRVPLKYLLGRCISNYLCTKYQTGSINVFPLDIMTKKKRLTVGYNLQIPPKEN